MPSMAWWLRAGLLGVLGLVCVVFWTPTNDIYSLPKFVVLVIGAGLLLGALAWSAVDDGALFVPRALPFRLGAAVMAALLVAWAINGDRVISLVGEYGRNAG